ncbi:hypothetical protein [Streptomyces peucetius]|uniref:Uncharacterized protein n=1 Tax=Streptomyces peucetius TaxID=1950 RepID=A0ABY6I505_STRPE|nr:hypothetical protein [Streptomyces peucetius]UYQ61824.1 hypothetical protein OGH68_10180 [Streptomyces peucetius]
MTTDNEGRPGEFGPPVPPGTTRDTSPGPARPSPLRRLLRNRTVLAATAAGLVGVLLGAGTVAWRTDTLPLLKPDPCWDSLRDSSVSALFGDRRLEVDEQALRRDPSTASLSYGQCRITSFKGEEARRQAVVRVHSLDGLYGNDGRRWPAEFLSSRMVALGDGLPGMVSASRAWLALPQSCVGRPGLSEGATVVDVALGEHDFDTQSEYDGENRDAMTRVVVDAANGVIRELGCTGTYRAPEELPALPEWEKVRPDAFCGVKGLELPAAYRKSLELNRLGGEGGAARTCDSGRDGYRGIRMSTVVDPAVAEVYSLELRKGGARVKGTKGGGMIGPTRAVYRLSCQTGPVVMVVEDIDLLRSDVNFVRDLLPAYVEAESERIGCGPVKVTPAAS